MLGHICRLPTVHHALSLTATCMRSALLISFLGLAIQVTPLAHAGAEPGNPQRTAISDAQNSDTDTEFMQCPDSGEPVCRFLNIIVLAAERHQVEPALVMAIIQAESRYDPNAVSEKGARGLMQLMPGTAKSLGVENIFDPLQNIDAGVRYLKRLILRFKGNWKLALAAYNAGVYNVIRHGGVPPFPSTRIYVRRVIAYYQRYKNEPLKSPPLFADAEKSIQDPKE